MLYISKNNLSKKQIAYLKSFGAFWNPKFFERQRQRLSTYNVPRIVDLTVDLSDYIALPRGVEDRLTKIVSHFNWTDQTIVGNAIKVKFNGDLTKEQNDAEKQMLKYSNGVLSARTGFGKTVIAASIISKRKISTLILVNNRDLAEQWKARLNSFLKISSDPIIEEYTPTGRKRKKDVIGKYYGTTHNRSGVIDIATIQSFKDTKQDQEILDDYGMVIFDEVHHLPAYSYDTVFKNIRAQYMYGLSATPYRKDGLSRIITLRIGDIRYQTKLIDSQYGLKISKLVVPRFTTVGLNLPELQTNTINENYELLVANEKRNKSLLSDIQYNLKNGRHILLLTHRVDHLKKIEGLLENIEDYSVFKLFGTQGSKQNNKVIKEINSTQSPFVIVATTKYAGEGMDIGNLDTIILAMPNSWKGTIFQNLGRLHRNLDKKDELRVYDYIDMLVPAFARMYQKRKEAYKKLGYRIQEDKNSRKQNVNLYEGNYHSAIEKSVKNARKVILFSKSMTRFIYWEIIYKMKDACTILLNKISEPYNKKLQKSDISYTLTEKVLPECILIDDGELWLSSDKGFNSNKGIAICITSPDTINGFKRMLQNEL